MYTRLGLTMVGPGLLDDPYANLSTTGLTQQEEVDAICRYQPCGSKLCPCAAGATPGSMPGMAPKPQVLPELTTSAPFPVLPVILFIVGLLALSKSRGGRDW